MHRRLRKYAGQIGECKKRGEGDRMQIAAKLGSEPGEKKRKVKIAQPTLQWGKITRKPN